MLESLCAYLLPASMCGLVTSPNFSRPVHVPNALPHHPISPLPHFLASSFPSPKLPSFPSTSFLRATHFLTTPFSLHSIYLTASPAPPSCASTFLVGCLRNELGEDSPEPPWSWLEFTGYSYMWPVGSSCAELYCPGFCSHWGRHQEHLYPKLFSSVPTGVAQAKDCSCF